MAVEFNAENERIERYVSSARYREALDHLEALDKLQLDKSERARINYLTAYSLHSLGIDLNRALDNYNLALEKGYDEFWVLYNRGALYRELGDIEAARIDLDRAARLDPTHEGAKQFRDAVISFPLLDKDHLEIKLASPIIACCVPKSGTLLLRNILISVLGDNLVIPSNSFGRPLATQEYLLALPALTNRVYVGHIWYSEDLSTKLASIPKIVLIRDPRDNVVSYSHFMNRVAKDVFGTHEEFWSNKDWDDKVSTMIFGSSSPVGWKTYPSVFNSYLNYGIKWAGPNTLIVRYEDLIGIRFGGNDKTVTKTMKSVMDFIGVQIDEETLALRISQGSDPTKSETFRLGGKGNWRQEFKPRHVTQMKAVAPNLVSTLGYEISENWNLSTTSREGILSEINLKANCLGNVAAISTTQYLLIRKESEGKKELERVIDEWALNIFIENEQYQDAILILEQLLNQAPGNPTWNYLYALSLHQLRKHLTKALRHYNFALDFGYDEFWVKYNRGLLLIEMGDKIAGVADLERAQRLKPGDKATQETLMTIQTLT